MDKGEAPKTHSGTHTRFAFHFVARGPISLSTGSMLTDAFAARQRSDYNTAVVTDEAAAADLLADAHTFIGAVLEVLKGES